MKKTFALLLLITSAQIQGQTIHPDWIPYGWKKLAEGRLVNVYNVSAYTDDSFAIVFVPGSGVCTTVVFRQEAPMATDKSLDRAYKGALTYFALNKVVKVHGTSCANGAQLSTIH